MTTALPDDVARARVYVLSNLKDEAIPWHTARAALGNVAPEPLTAALNDLETEGTVVYGLDGIRRPRRGDPGAASLDDVAAAVMALDWTPGRTHGDRQRPQGAWSIREVYEVGLRGRFRHVDVYNAMHERLKGRALKAGRVYWTRLETGTCACGCGTPTVSTWAVGHDGRYRGELHRAITNGEHTAAARRAGLPMDGTPRERFEVAVRHLEGNGHGELAAELTRNITPLLPETFEQQLAGDVAELAAAEEQLDEAAVETVVRHKARQLEGKLRDRYAEQRGIPRDDVEYEVLNGRIDVLDRGRRRVVEAKLDVGLTSVCQAVGQAEGYLYVVQRFNEATVDQVAVLLPKKPGPIVLDYLGTLVAERRRVGLVYLEGDHFVEHAFDVSATPPTTDRRDRGR
jgi:hypothetical protein